MVLNFLKQSKLSPRLSEHASLLLAFVICLLLLLLTILCRPQLPIDETRYISVAWEMHLHHQWFLPTINGEPYSHKPPLLMWLINLSWSIFGVHDWSARIVIPLFSMLNLWLIQLITKELFPETSSFTHDIVRRAPLALISLAGWTLFVPMTMFDLLLTACVQWQLYCMLRWSKAPEKIRYIWIAGIACGAGLLTKGPVMLLDVLPALLLYPFWREEIMPSNRKWFKTLLITVLIGSFIVLSWAIPAAILGGQAYRDAIFLHQTIDRMQDSFAHAHSWYWYLLMLPVLTFPWSLVAFAALFRSGRQRQINFFKNISYFPYKTSLTFLGSWFFIPLLVFSFISGKQPHYLYPLFPALAIFLSYLVSQYQIRYTFLPGILLGIIGFMILTSSVVLPFILPQYAPGWPALPAGLLLLGISYVLVRNKMQHKFIWFSASSPILLAAILIAGQTYFTQYQNVSKTAALVATYQQQKIPVVYEIKYPDLFQFSGRLTEPLMSFDGMDWPSIQQWLSAHPTAKVIVNAKKLPEGISAEATFPFRSKYFFVVDADTYMKWKRVSE